MIQIYFNRFSEDTFAKQLAYAQALATNIRPRIYCNETMRRIFNIGDEYNGNDVVIDNDIDDCIFIIMAHRDEQGKHKRGNVVLPYIFGNVSEYLLDRVWFIYNDYKWIGYPDDVVRKKKRNMIEKTFGIKVEGPVYSYCVCEETVRLDKKKCGVTLHPVASNEEKTIPMIWYKLNTNNDWHRVVAQKDTNGEYCKFYISDEKVEELVNVKYLYKCKHKDSWIWW